MEGGDSHNYTSPSAPPLWAMKSKLTHIYAAYSEVDCLDRVRKPGLGSRPDSHFNMYYKTMYVRV